MKSKSTKFLFAICFAFTLFFSCLFNINTISTLADTITCTESECNGTYNNGICSSNPSHYQQALDSNSDTFYEISNAGQLVWFANQVNSGNTTLNAILTADINLKNVSINPIGNATYKYTGIFNGNRHTISNYSFTSSSEYVGLFGYVYEGGIKELTVSGSVIANGTSTQHVGLMVARMQDSGFYNCKAVGTVNCTSSIDSFGVYFYIGGMIGVANHSVIVNCASEVNITSSLKAPAFVSVGGIVGVATISSNTVPNCILNSYSTGNITVSGTINSSASSSTNARYNVGGIAGYLLDDAVNNYYYGTITDNVTNYKNIGKLFGYVVTNFSESSASGIIIVKNNYYLPDKSAVGTINGTSSYVETKPITENNFKATSGTPGSLVDILAENITYVNEIIQTHREVLSNSAWADIVTDISGDTLTAYNWKNGTNNNLPTFNTHIYDSCLDTTCNICGEIRPASEHKYTDCEDTTCNKCTTTRTAPGHLYTDCEDTQCNTCQTTRVAPGHSYTNCLDAECNNCVHVRQAGHIYDNCLDTACNVCYEVREALEHIYTNCEDTICDNCPMTRIAPGHSFDNCLDAQCNNCSFTKEIAEHTYDTCDDIDCNVCLEIREPIPHTYDNCNDIICNVCSTLRMPKDHRYTDCNDATCEDCSFVRIPSHTYTDCEDEKCSVCGEIRETSGHVIVINKGVEPTCHSDGFSDSSYCLVCNKVIEKQIFLPKLGHNFTGEYEYDSNQHWHICENEDCLAIDKKENHIDNDHNYYCDKCKIATDAIVEDNSNANGIQISPTVLNIVIFVTAGVIIFFFLKLVIPRKKQ